MTSSDAQNESIKAFYTAKRDHMPSILGESLRYRNHQWRAQVETSRGNCSDHRYVGAVCELGKLGVVVLEDAK